MDAHIEALEERHQMLEQKLSEQLAKVSADELEIVALKREKLQIKDQIVRLRQHKEMIQYH